MSENIKELTKLVSELEKRKNVGTRWKHDPEAFINECLDIYPKDPSLGKIKLTVNAAQKLVVDLFNKQMADDGLVRMIII